MARVFTRHKEVTQLLERLRALGFLVTDDQLARTMRSGGLLRFCETAEGEPEYVKENQGLCCSVFDALHVVFLRSGLVRSDRKAGAPKKVVRAQTCQICPIMPNRARISRPQRKLAGDDPVLTKTWTFFCTVNDINAPRPGIEATKVFDNLYAIPSSKARA